MSKIKGRLSIVAWIAGAVCCLNGLALAQIPVNGTSPSTSTPTYDIDQSGRIPYQATVTVSNINDHILTVNFNPVSAGHRLVIQQVSAQLAMQDIVPADTKLLAAVTNSAFGDFYFFSATPFLGTDLVGNFGQSLQFFVNAGDHAVLRVNTPVSNFDYVTVTLVGYLLDCNAAPCAGIAGEKSGQRLKVPAGK